MITFTDSAVAQIQQMQSAKAQPGQRLRIFVEPGGCSGFEYGMSFDVCKDEDAELSHNGVTFLIDATSLEYLDGSEVDFDDGLNGKGFRNPQSECDEHMWLWSLLQLIQLGVSGRPAVIQRCSL
jgi:iron-sulfur cluster assembly protein/iron-sulfur cluster insertion protein